MAFPAVSTQSWSNIVTGKSADDSPLCPAEKGACTVKCCGELLVMLGHYGWIQPRQQIHHADANKHGGRIYVQRKDFRKRSEPQVGDEVNFCLYADSDGLGAEDCYVVGESSCSEVQPDDGWVNQATHDSMTDDCSMDPLAQEFVPSIPSSFNMEMFAYNMSFFSDDDSDSDDEFEASWKSERDDDSTNAGDSSDSDLDLALLRPPPGLDFPVLPPGLEAFHGSENWGQFEPPPGLELIAA